MCREGREAVETANVFGASDDELSEKNLALLAAWELRAEFSLNGPPPNTCNTGGTSSQIGDSNLDSGGVDTLEVSCYGMFDYARFIELQRQLKGAQQRARDGVDGAYIVTSEGDQLTVAEHGVRKGAFCKWVLKWKGCTFAIRDSGSPSDHLLSVHVTIGSIYLMEVGHVQAWDSVMRVLALIGYRHTREVVGRVDLCVDLPDVSMDVVDAAIFERRFIARARKNVAHRMGDELETYTRGGGGDVMVRLYNKAKECAKDPVKQVALIQNRWGKLCEDHAVRVEFQLRGKALKQHFSVRSVVELFANLGTIATWCSDEWFRITATTVDRKNKNQGRAGVSEFWATVQESFKKWTCPALPRVRKINTLKPDFKSLKQQAVGCVVSIAAHFDDSREFLNHWREIGEEYVGETKKKVEEKRRHLAALCRVSVDLSGIPF